jgi:hypothetical protein
MLLSSLVRLLDPEEVPQVPVEGGGGGVGGAIGGILYLVILGVFVVSLFKVFAKAGKPGWAAFVPIYNVITLLDIAGKPVWWFILLGVPVVNFIILFLVTGAIAKQFGKSAGFGIGLLILPFVFYPMLAFGDAKYEGAPKPA